MAACASELLQQAEKTAFAPEPPPVTNRDVTTTEPPLVANREATAPESPPEALTLECPSEIEYYPGPSF